MSKLVTHLTRENVIKGTTEEPPVNLKPEFNGQLFIGSTNRMFLGDLSTKTWIENVNVKTLNNVEEKLNLQIKDTAKDVLIEDGKLYLKKSDGTKLGYGVLLPVSGGDESGGTNIDLSKYIKSVNGAIPDVDGAVNIQGNQIPCWDSHGTDKGNVHSYIDYLCGETGILREQINENKNSIDFINLSDFGKGFVNFKEAIDYCKANNKKLNIDIDIDLENTESILIDFDLTINGNYKNIKIDNDLFICSGSLFIDKIIVDEKESGFYKLCYLKKDGQLTCTNSKFLNFKHIGVPKECIIFDIENGSKSYFNNIEINNIKTKGNGTVTDGIGSQRFIRTKENQNDDDVMGVTVIKNIFVNDFYNIDNNGNPVTEDSDPIVFQHGVKMFHNSTIENVKGKNIGKRFIKVQSPNVTINNIYLNNTSFSEEVTAISIQRNVTNVIIDGLAVEGNLINSRAIETFECENITISNVTLNIKSLKTQSGCAFVIGGKNIKLNNIKGNVGGFLAFINEGTQNITVENVYLNVEYYSIYYSDFENGLKANIRFNNVNLNYKDNSFVFQCVIFRNGTNVINDVYFNNCNLNLLNSYNYGVLSLIYCSNFHFRNCILNTNSIGYGVYLNNSNNIVISNTFMDKLTINIANCYLLNSKIDYIESISNNNKILISSLLTKPTIKHSASSTQGVLVKPYNIS